MSNEVDIKWLSQPEEKDYPAAESYLSLSYDCKEADKIMDKLRH